MQKILLEHWKGGYEKKSNSREVVLFKNKTERQVQGEIWNMSEKGDPSFFFCWEFFCMFSCPLTCPSTPQNLAHYLLISWESKNRLSIAASQELLFSWSSFHWELEWRAFGLSPYRENWPGSCTAGLGQGFVLLVEFVRRQVSLVLYLPWELHPDGWQLW